MFKDNKPCKFIMRVLGSSKYHGFTKNRRLWEMPRVDMQWEWRAMPLLEDTEMPPYEHRAFSLYAACARQQWCRDQVLL